MSNKFSLVSSVLEQNAFKGLGKVDIHADCVQCSKVAQFSFFSPLKLFK